MNIQDLKNASFLPLEIEKVADGKYVMTNLDTLVKTYLETDADGKITMYGTMSIGNKMITMDFTGDNNDQYDILCEPVESKNIEIEMADGKTIKKVLGANVDIDYKIEPEYEDIYGTY